ncbi:MAG: alpha/beta fold hydrolase [Vigna little leaf phytoplasma]|nr:alpha/beta fold hydrolase [Vigna little leaf phytoplasma]
MFINNHICYVKFHKASNSKANLIILHGMGESSHDYLHLVTFFQNLDYNVIIYDHIGHGKSGGKRGDISHFSLWIDNLKHIVNFVKTKNSLKIFLIGHSMGGVIINNYVIKHNNVDGVIISATPTIFCSLTKYLRYPFYFFNWKKIKLNFNSKKIIHNSLKQNYFPYRLDYVTPRFLRNLLFLSISFLQKKIKSYVTPILCLYGLQDKIVRYDNGSYLIKNILSKDKNLILYQKSYHNLFHDIEKDKILIDIYLWLEQRK